MTTGSNGGGTDAARGGRGTGRARLGFPVAGRPDAPAVQPPGARPGQGLVLFVVMLPLFFAVVGLTIDGGIVWAARREAQNLADGAARAGADQLDVARYRETNGDTVQIDPPLARMVAGGFLDGQPFEWTIGATPGGVTVTVVREVPLSFMKLFGFGRVRIAATGSARPLFGIAEGRP